MEELSEILKGHAKKYKTMRPCDAVKLIYQNEFGGGHFVADVKESLGRLAAEYAKTKRKAGLPLFEDIGGRFVRLNLAAVNDALLPLTVINRIFVASSDAAREDRGGFVKKLGLLYSLACDNVFPFSAGELSDYLYDYSKRGFPPVSHSGAYKNAYHPAYRIVDKSYAKLLPVAARIEELLWQKEKVLVGIDGHAAAGKTTAAALLSKIFDCNIVHTDDFFLPYDMRTHNRLSEAGGNIHYERLKSEVLDPLINNKTIEYRVFNCASGTFSNVVRLEPKALTVIEGSYSLHPYFGGVYDISVFLSIGAEEQKERIFQRNGHELYKRFIDEWIPMEKKYFSRHGIRRRCDYIL